MTLHWTCNDGVRLAGDRFHARQPRAQAVIVPAMGVPRRFYGRFAAYLAERGIVATTFDYRDRADARLQDWGALDLEALLADADPELPLFVIGHSCGGQVVGLAPSSERLAGMVLVAAQSAYWRHWRGRGRAGMWLLWHAAIPLLARGRRFPARRLGLGGRDVPGGVARQWAAWGRRPRYLFQPALGLDTERYRRLRLPALTYGFDDDGYAPGAAIEALLREYPGLAVVRKQLRAADLGLDRVGHMGFFRAYSRDALWRPTADWLLATAAGGPAAGAPHSGAAVTRDATRRPRSGNAAAARHRQEV